MKSMSVMPEKNSDSSHKIMLVDGYGFVFRAYHSLPPLTRGDGTPVGAVYGFTNMLYKLINSHEMDSIAVLLDAGSKTFRNQIYNQYKANRPPAPEDLIPQFPLVREAVEALNLPAIELEGYEADDLIATYTKLAKEKGYEVVIVSSDKDLMQLVDDSVHMYDPLKSRKIGIEEVVEKFGVTPDKVLDLLSLMGDSSDNIPGIPGIGPKTASELINQFGSLDEIIKRAGEIKQNKRRESVIENADAAFLSRDLVRLCYDVQVPVDLADLKVRDIDSAKLLDFLEEQNFKALASKIKRDASGGKVQGIKEVKQEKKTAKVNLIEIKTIDQLKNFLNSEREISSFGLHLEYLKDDKILIVTSLGELRSSYIILNSKDNLVQDSLFEDVKSNSDNILINDVLEALIPIFEDESIVKYAHNIKSVLRLYSSVADISKVKNIDDIELMSYVLESGENAHDIASLGQTHLEFEKENLIIKSYEDNIKEYALKISEFLPEIYKVLKSKLFEDNLLSVYEKIERPLIYVVTQMENNGIKVNQQFLSELSEEFSKKIKLLEKEIHHEAGKEFNIGSPKQLGEILFDEMGISGGKKSKKSGAYTTNVEVLEGLANQGFTIAENVLKWRQLSKLKSTYTDALGKSIGVDGRIHTNFSMAATTTGRLSSNNPNLQNIPIRSEEGNKIRKAFVAKDGYKLISADYSQIELRLLAHVAEIDVLKNAFKNGQDIHATTASQMFGLPLDKVDSELRRKAKMINFGIIYGISAFGLANRLGIGREEAAQYISLYFKQYPGIRTYMDKTIEFCQKHGFVHTLWGRKCHIKGISNKNASLRQFSERAAINAPLQGSAADIIKKAMILLQKELESKNIDAKILLQVHDELILEAAEKDAENVAKITKNIMESAAIFSIPFTVEVGVGYDWAEIH